MDASGHAKIFDLGRRELLKSLGAAGAGVAASRLASTAAEAGPTTAAVKADATAARNAVPKDAELATQKANAALLNELDFTDRADFDDAKRGFIAAPTNPIIKDADGREVWNLEAYDFLKGMDAPATVNPSLWRQAQLNMNAGLFKVVYRIYQVRGLDASNMTIVEGDTSIIVIDPLISTETARAALDLYFRHREKRPVAAVIYTHSHVDHFGGVKGVVTEADVKSARSKFLPLSGFSKRRLAKT